MDSLSDFTITFEQGTSELQVNELQNINQKIHTVVSVPIPIDISTYVMDIMNGKSLHLDM